MATVYKSPQWLMPENSNQSKVSNYSFEFDGINDHISLSDIPFLRAGGQNFSISAWVYHTAIGQGGYFGSRIAPSSTNTINFYRNTNGSAVLLINNSSTGNIERRSPNNTITTNNWHHVVATFDGTQTDAADRVNIYVDGVLDNGYQSGTGTNLPSGSTGIYNFLGRIYLGVRQTGKIDNLAIWDSTLTAGNVTTLYNGGEPVDVTTLSPVAGWKLGEAANFTDNWLVNNSALDNYSTRSFGNFSTGDYIQFGDIPLTGAFCISAWLNLNAVTNETILGDSSNLDWLRIDNANDLKIKINGSTTTISNTGAFSSGSWFHLAVVRDSSDVITVYKNGSALSTTATASGTFTPERIGFKTPTPSNYDGFIDEVAIWNSELTSGNITTIYNSGEPDDISSLSPLSWWRMGEDATFNGTDFTLPDNGSASNTGTSSGMVLNDLTGEAPNYTGGGLSANMTIEDRVGNAPNSNNNAVSYNMDEVDRETDVPS